jgi:signal transduction histidine kinase/Tfp pilus assembly protein PilF
MISVRSTIFNFFSLVIIVITLQGNLFAQTKATIQLIDSLNQLSYHLRRNSPKLSLKYAIDAYELSKGTNYSKGFAAAIHNRGTAKAVLGQYDQSLKDLLDAAKIREEINDISGLTSSYNNLGYVFSEMQNDRKALDYYTKSLECHRKSDNAKEIGIVLNNIGWVQLRSKKLDLALEYFYMALKANEQENDERGVGASLSNLGTVYRQMGQYQKGLEYHLKALGIAEKHSDKFGLCNTLFYISEDYFKLKRIEESTVYALKSFILAKDIGMLSDEKKAAALLAQIYESRKKYEESNKYLKLVSSLNDSLFSIEKAETVGKIQSYYEIENQAKENALLKKEQLISNQKIRQQLRILFLSIAIIALALFLSYVLYSSKKKLKLANALLVTKNDEINYQREVIEIKADALDEKNQELTEINAIKDKLISVIAHDLKNPLHAVVGYSEVLINRIPQTETNKEIISFLRIIHDNAIRGNLLLENLLQWSRFQTRSIQFLPVEQKIDKLINEELYFVQPIAAEKKVKISCEFDKDLTVNADSNMLRTIIRNLVSNAIKFSTENGIIRIKAEINENTALFSVADNGVGISEKVKSKLFTGEAGITTEGTSGEKGTGIGLMLCKDFIEKHSGSIWVESKEGKGTTFFFTLPLLPQND